MVSLNSEIQDFYNSMNDKINSLNTKTSSLIDTMNNFQSFNSAFGDNFSTYYKGKAQTTALQNINAINETITLIMESVSEKIGTSLQESQSILDSTKQLIELKNKINNAEYSTEVPTDTEGADKANTTSNDVYLFNTKQKEVLEKLRHLKGLDEVITVEENDTSLSSAVNTADLIPGTYKEYKYTASNGVTVTYYAYIPENIETTEGLPIHLHLWPSRSNGGPLGYYNVHGLPKLLSEGQSASGVVICPKLEADEVYDAEHLAALKELSDSYVNTYKCDANRISISGQGGGGQGAINMAAKYPNYFTKVISLYSLDTAYNYDEIGLTNAQARANLSQNDITLIRCTGGGSTLDSRSSTYTSELYSSLSPYVDIDVYDNPFYIYGDDLFGGPFTYEGKTYTNMLEYCLSQTREEPESVTHKA